MNDKKTNVPTKPLTPAKENYKDRLPTHDHGITRKDSQVTKVTNSLPPPPPKKKS